MQEPFSKKDIEIQNRIKSKGNLPAHIAIIMDGNGRWAKKMGLPRIAGHKRGVESVRNSVRTASALGIQYLTLYTFSTENWRRPKDEVSTLMRLLLKSLKKETDELNKNNVRLMSIGDLDYLPTEVYNELLESQKKTATNTGLVLNLALSYSGRWDITNAVKKIANDIFNKKIKPEEIDQNLFSNYLSTAGMPDVDLLIRTSGELRISNFLLWQLAYSEICVLDIYWPELKNEHIYKAVQDYQNRERRFGMVSEQIEPKKRGQLNDKK